VEKPNKKKREKNPKPPVGKPPRGKGGGADLDQEPRGNNVSRGDAINFSALQLLEEAAHNIYVISRRVPGRQKYASRTDAFVRCTIEKMKGKMSTQTVTSEKSKDMEMPKVVSPKEWEGARQQLLVKEKVLTRARDALAAERRRMPWLAVEKGYDFDGPKGKVSLLDLFDSRRQLVIYRAF